MQKHKQKAKESERLGESVTKETISFKFNGHSPMLIHKPCFNNEITQENLKGLIQVRQNNDDSFRYECRKCGETWSYK